MLQPGAQHSPVGTVKTDDRKDLKASSVVHGGPPELAVEHVQIKNTSRHRHRTSTVVSEPSNSGWGINADRRVLSEVHGGAPELAVHAPIKNMSRRREQLAFVGTFIFGPEQLAGYQAENEHNELRASTALDGLGWDSSNSKGTDSLSAFVTNSRGSKCVSAADIDGDGDPDILVARSGNNLMYINEGGGVLRPETESAFVTDSHSGIGNLEVVDIDGDGDLDVLLAILDGTYSKNNAMYLNDGAGQLQKVTESVFVTDGGSSTDVEVSDLDGDGDLDILVANNGQNDAMYINNGVGEFESVTDNDFVTDPDSPEYGVVRFPEISPYGGSDESRCIKVADIDGDGDLDILVGKYFNAAIYINDAPGVFRKDTESAFADGSGNPGSPDAIEAVDIDGDGDVDVLVAYVGSQQPNQMFLNDGAGGLHHATEGAFVTDRGDSSALKAVDIDGDGDLDVLVANDASSGNAFNNMYLNMGAGDLQKVTAGAFVTDSGSSSDVQVVDIDGDGDMDVLIANNDGNNAMYINEGAPGERIKVTQGVFVTDGPTAATRDIAVVDIDEDGDLDILVANDGNNAMYINEGGGELQMETEGPFVTDNSDGTTDMEVVDIDGDGDLDVLTANGWSEIFPGIAPCGIPFPL
jgi:hypothetical protein